MLGKLEFKKGNIEDFRKIYKDMTEQFPPDELKSIDEFEELLLEYGYEFYLITENGNLIGYLLFTDCNNALWIDYVAVLKDFHSRGYGKRIFQQLKNNFDLDGCYLEVEKPNENNKNTLRRINFYKNLGAVKLDIDYYYPNRHGAIQMDLYFMPFKNSRGELEKTEILNAIQYVFDKLHHGIKHIKDVYLKIR